jgi:hypothetical protein
MGSSIKQKEKISENSPDDDIHCLPVGKPRSEEQADRMRGNRFAGLDDDLKNILRRTGGTLVHSEEVIPVCDAETFTQEDLDMQKKRRRYNTSWRH